MESMFEASTEHPPADSPFFKPLEVKCIKVKREKPSLGQFVGPASKTKRNDGNADITLKFGDKLFEAHKDVLREASDFIEKEPSFQPITGTPKRAKRSEMPTFDLNAANLLPPDVTVATLDQVIDFAYTGLLPLFPDQGFQDFFAIAIALHFKNALDIHWRYLRILYKHEHRVVSPGIAAGVLSLTQTVSEPVQFSHCSGYLRDLFDETAKYLLREPLDKLIGDKDFLKGMTSDGMLMFLGREDLVEHSDESKVLDLTLAWVEYDQNHRQQYAGKLLEKIHLGVLPQSRLTSLASEVKNLPGCKDVIEEVLKLMETKEDALVPLHYSHPHLFAARNEMLCDAIVGIGPIGMFWNQCLLYFNTHGPEKRQGWQDWCDFSPIPDDEFPVYDASLLSVDGKLYLAGGCDNTYRRRPKFMTSWWFQPCSGKMNIGHVYECKLGEKTPKIEEEDDCVMLKMSNPWSMVSGMEPRRSFPMVHLDGFLYAIGGEDEDNKAMKEVERYNLNHKESDWEIIADLPVPCYYACATAYKGKILVYGSQAVPDSDTPAQHDLQMYDPATNKWEVLLTEHHKIAKYMKEEEDANKSDTDMDDDANDAAKVNDGTAKDGANGAERKEDGSSKQDGSDAGKKKDAIEKEGAERKEDGSSKQDGSDAGKKKDAIEKEGAERKEDGSSKQDGSDAGKKKDAIEKEGGADAEKKKDGTNKDDGADAEKKEDNTNKIATDAKSDTKDAEESDADSDDIIPWLDYRRAGEEKKEIGSLLPRNALVVDGEDCFRVVYTTVRSSGRLASDGEKLQPVVHQLDFDFVSSPPSVKLCKVQDQKLMPTTSEGAFQIHNKVYINMRGCVHYTGIKITPGQKKTVDLGVWKKLLKDKDINYEDMSFANFTFNKKTFCRRCVQGKSCANSWASDSDSESDTE